MVRDGEAAASLVPRGEIGIAGVLYLALAVVLLAPALGSGALLHLDLVVTAHADVGGGIWGLGPELPRLFPFEVPLGAAAALTSGSVVKVVLVLAPAFGAAGTHRLARSWGASLVPSAGAGLLYGFGPWMMTRVTVGHLTMIGAAALLPWAVGPLSRVRTDRQFVAAAAGMAVFGFYGGMVGALVVAAAAVGRGRPPTWRVVARFLVPQLVWLTPGIFVLASVGSLGGSDLFPSGVDEVSDIPALAVGHGFWQDHFQVGGDPGALEASVGAMVTVLAIAGLRGLPRPARRASAVLVLAPLALVVADSVPGVRGGFAAVTRVGPFAALREPQRLMVVALLVGAVGVALGADLVRTRVQPMWRPAVLLVPLAAAAVLAAPAGPHIRERLDPIGLPEEWAAARSAIAAQPGSVLVLPFDRYLNLGLADNQRVLNPTLAYFGSAVMISSDLGLGGDSAERGDPREPAVLAALPLLRGPDSDASVLADLGIDWVLILHEIDYEQYLVLLDDPALESAIAAGSLDLLHVRSASGLATLAGGASADLDKVIEPLYRLADGTETVTLDRPYQWGWLRGFTPVSRNVDGRLLAEGSSRWVWYWPAALIALVDLTVVVVSVGWMRRDRNDTYHAR